MTLVTLKADLDDILRHHLLHLAVYKGLDSMVGNCLF